MTQQATHIYSMICRTVCSLVVFVAGSLPMFAAGYSVGDVEHRISVGLGGGMTALFGPKAHRWEDATPYFKQDHPDGSVDVFTPYRSASAVRNGLGGDALFDVGYELRKGRFLFGIGVRVQFDQLNASSDTLEAAFGREYIGREDGSQAAKYNYYFEQYDDHLRVLQCAVPIYFGMEAGRYMYWHIGATLGYAFYAQHETDARFRTELTLPRLIGTENGTFRNAPSMGAFSMTAHNYRAEVENVNRWSVSPMVEVGARFQAGGRVQMRVGVYAGYTVQLGWVSTKQTPIVAFSDNTVSTGTLHSMADVSAQNEMQDAIRQKMILNPILYSELTQKAYSNLTIGIKWTTLISVGRKRKICNCFID